MMSIDNGICFGCKQIIDLKTLKYDKITQGHYCKDCKPDKAKQSAKNE